MEYNEYQNLWRNFMKGDEDIFSQFQSFCEKHKNKNIAQILDSKVDKSSSAIHRVVQRFHNELLQLLIDYGADVNNQNIYGNTALHFLIHTNVEELGKCLAFLIKHKDLNFLHLQGLIKSAEESTQSLRNYLNRTGKKSRSQCISMIFELQTINDAFLKNVLEKIMRFRIPKIVIESIKTHYPQVDSNCLDRRKIVLNLLKVYPKLVELGIKDCSEFPIELDDDGIKLMDKIDTYVAKNTPRALECWNIILNCENVDLNVAKLDGYTPLLLAVFLKNKLAVKRLLQEANKGKLDLDLIQVDGLTAREAIEKTFETDLSPSPNSETKEEKVNPEIVLKGRRRIVMSIAYLFSILREQEHTERFIDSFHQVQDKYKSLDLHKKDNGKYTLLQSACFYNRLGIVKFLIENGADVTYKSNCSPFPPLIIACRNGHINIVEYLISELTLPKYVEKVNDQFNLLFMVKDYGLNPDCWKDSMKIVLRNLDKLQLDINVQDMSLNTPLHCAVKDHPQALVNELLNHGSRWDIENNDRDIAFWTKPQTFEKYLDDQIEDDEQSITFKFLFMSFYQKKILEKDTAMNKKNDIEHGGERRTLLPNTAPREEMNLPLATPERNLNPGILEMVPLMKLFKYRNLKHLVTHPVISTFISIKWQKYQRFYYIDLFFFLSFYLLINSFIILNQNTSSSQSLCTKVVSFFTFKIICILFIIILFVREFSQFIQSWKNHFKNSENILEFIIIFSSFYIIIHENCCKKDAFCQILTIVLVLSSSLELLLLLGRHPRLSTQVEIFVRVTFNYLHFWIYIFLLMGFATAFTVVFQNCEEDVCESNDFKSYGTSFYRTLVMVSGELNAPQLSMQKFDLIPQLLVIAFIFFIVIVLMNLLSGLAVDDSKKIRDDAHLYESITRIKFICSVEKTLCSLGCFFPRWIIDRDNWRMPLRGCKVNKKTNQVESSFSYEEKIFIDESIVAKAREIISKKDDCHIIELITKLQEDVLELKKIVSDSER